MKKYQIVALAVLVLLSVFQLGMGKREGQYDEEARLAEREEKSRHKTERTGNPATRMAEGVKQATVDSAAGFISDTADATSSGSPVLGTLEGARQGSGKILDNTVKGAVKVATLGYGDVTHYEVEEPEHGKDDTTKIRIKIPGT